MFLCVDSTAYSGAYYGRGRGPIHLDDVRCTGNQQRLIDCSYTNNTFRQGCSHVEDAAVYCQTSTFIIIRHNMLILSSNTTEYIYTTQALQCQEDALRLTGGSTINQGRVEICVNEIWGTICATYWGQPEATATCRQLGFSENGIQRL